MNENKNNINQSTSTEPKRFTTINAAALMAQEFEPLQFAVEKILPHGLFILAGSGKIGKSWLALDICTVVASGGKLWDFNAGQGDVLYLALEDNYPRLQERLKKIQAENEMDISRLELTTASFGISNGLLEQTHNFIEEHPDTKLIVIDTLERIRDTEQDKSMYSCDYRDMTALREITNKYKLTLLLIHHTRKMYDPDPLNTLSGSTGLVGSVDGVHVLEKTKRIGEKAKLTIANRDTQSYCFRLEFAPDNCKWLLIGNDVDTPDDDSHEADERLCSLINGFLKDEWKGTATDLCNGLKTLDGGFNHSPAVLGKKLTESVDFLKDEFGIIADSGKKNKRFITLSRTNE